MSGRVFGGWTLGGSAMMFAILRYALIGGLGLGFAGNLSLSAQNLSSSDYMTRDGVCYKRVKMSVDSLTDIGTKVTRYQWTPVDCAEQEVLKTVGTESDTVTAASSNTAPSVQLATTLNTSTTSSSVQRTYSTYDAETRTRFSQSQPVVSTYDAPNEQAISVSAPASPEEAVELPPDLNIANDLLETLGDDVEPSRSAPALQSAATRSAPQPIITVPKATAALRLKRKQTLELPLILPTKAKKARKVSSHHRHQDSASIEIEHEPDEFFTLPTHYKKPGATQEGHGYSDWWHWRNRP